MEAQLNGIRLVWDEVGRASTAPPFLLVHGFPLNRTMWRPQLAALAASTALSRRTCAATARAMRRPVLT
jgi:pimeloyl-ACP methyl ester carboxylesterase